MSMNHRERVLAAFQRKPVDRLPTDMCATPEVQEQLYEHFGIRGGPAGPSWEPRLCLSYPARETSALIELWNLMGIDGTLFIGVPYIGLRRRFEGDIYYTEWGLGYQSQHYGNGAYDETVVYPLAECETIADLEAFPWPTTEEYDYSAMPGLAEECQDRAVGLGWMAPFYYHNLLRGLELSLMDPLLHPEFTHYLMDKITTFLVDHHRCALEASGGRIDMVHISDDFGSQESLLISPRVFDAFYRPYLQRCIDMVKSFDALVFHHDDGDIRRVLPALVEMGIDVLNPVQWRCGDWDLAAIKEQLGSRICFHGGGDVQQTLPFGTPADVRNEVKWLIETLASDRTGFVIGPGHNLQPGTPTENIIALYEAAHEFGAF